MAIGIIIPAIITIFLTMMFPQNVTIILDVFSEYREEMYLISSLAGNITGIFNIRLLCINVTNIIV